MRFADNRNKIRKYIPAVVFLIFIYGMALWFIFSPKPDYSSSEKRYLQKFPEVTAKNCFWVICSEFETFFADRFPQKHMKVLTHTPPLQWVTTVQAVCITAK